MFLLDLKPGDYQLNIYDVYGKSVHRNKATGATWVQANGWEPGLYFVEVKKLESEEKMIGKVSIQH